MIYSEIAEIRRRAGLQESFAIVDFDPKVNSLVHDLEVKAKMGTIDPNEVNQLQRFLNSRKSEFIRLYHGTSASIDPIATGGLLPTSTNRRNSYQSSSGFVYLAYDPERAKQFGKMAFPKDQITVWVAEVLIRSLVPDIDQLNNMRSVGYDVGNSLAESFIWGGGARRKGKITNISMY